MSTVAHFFIIIVAQKFVITWLTFSLTFTVKDEAAIIPLFPSDSLKAHIKTRESSMD